MRTLSVYNSMYARNRLAEMRLSYIEELRITP